MTYAYDAMLTCQFSKRYRVLTLLCDGDYLSKRPISTEWKGLLLSPSAKPFTRPRFETEVNHN